ncbi:hypothetical protein EVJ58_g2347 [Rhodofomes roseus]|uniref:Uncharacterized protein n=1 Tax=Rhodofomes roseus TaxID=34475 RepID=A0A4Y9YSZ0_9APHY|nr:hypothetical protein EVJ58_g2347 [Rhodofomes roseus]
MHGAHTAPANVDWEKGKESPTSPVQGYIARKLSLSNYVAPGTVSMVTPPITPPGSGRMRSASLPTDAGTHADVPEQAPGEKDEEEEKDGEQAGEKEGGEERTSLPKPSFAIIGGQPATTASPAPATSPTSTSAELTKPSLAPLNFRLGTSELGAEMGVGVEGNSAQLLSPPSSPASIMSPLALGLSGLGSGSSNSSGSSTPTHGNSRPQRLLEPIGGVAARLVVCGAHPTVVLHGLAERDPECGYDAHA